MFLQGSRERALLGSSGKGSLQERMWVSLLQLCGYRFVWHCHLSLGVLLVAASVFCLSGTVSGASHTGGSKPPDVRKWGLIEAFCLPPSHDDRMADAQSPVCIMHHLSNIAAPNLNQVVFQSFPASEPGSWLAVWLKPLRWLNQDAIQGSVEGWEFTSEITQPHVAFGMWP